MAVRSKPLAQTIDIPEGTVTLRQLTEGDFIALADLEAVRDTLYERGQFVGYREERNRRRVERTAVYRTMESCSLTWESSADLIFNSKTGSVMGSMSEQEFINQWDQLPPDIANAIVGALYKVNPTLLGG